MTEAPGTHNPQIPSPGGFEMFSVIEIEKRPGSTPMS